MSQDSLFAPTAASRAADESLRIGGERVVVLERERRNGGADPTLVRAVIVPGRGMMLLQLTAWLPGHGETDLLATPDLARAGDVLDHDPSGAEGNASFSMGGALLLPFANRLTGTPSADGRSITACVSGRPVCLPANWGGSRPGARRYAMHGLALAARASVVEHESSGNGDTVRARWHAGDFGGHWVSSTDVAYEYTLTGEALRVAVTASNVGTERLPMGIGWHPYFALPSGARAQARVHVPARARVVVNDYDEVLPTGAIAPVAGTRYDLSPRAGRALGDDYFDDCFVELVRTQGGSVVARITDPAAAFEMHITTSAPQVCAVQVYAPPGQSYVALEPQFNLADPFGPEWGPDMNTGMALLEPGESVRYAVTVEPRALP